MTTMNPLEVYAEAGRKAGEALNNGDYATLVFHTQWLHNALALETKEWSIMARNEYGAAYKAARMAKL